MRRARLNGQVEKLVRRRRLGDLDVRAGAGLDELVAERFHPAMAVRPEQLLEGVALEALGPDGSPDANVHEDRRLESSAGFDGIDGLDKLGRVVAPAVVAPGEDGCAFHSRHSTLLQPLQVPNRPVHERRLHPARRASLDRDVPAEVAEHLLHLGRQHLERLPGPVLPFAADPVRLAETSGCRHRP